MISKILNKGGIHILDHKKGDNICLLYSDNNKYNIFIDFQLKAIHENDPYWLRNFQLELFQKQVGRLPEKVHYYP